MAADPNNDALKTELETAKAALEPEIRGMRDLASTSISAGLQGVVSNEVVEYDQRHSLIVDVLRCMQASTDAMARLEADGYPAPPPPPVLTGDQVTELAGQASDLRAGMSIFTAVPAPVAEVATITLGEPSPKQPAA